MRTVDLTLYEILTAARVGVDRHVSAIRDGRQAQHDRGETGFGRHIDGALGELALAKDLGIYWAPAVGWLDTEIGDVAGYHVKATGRASGCLIVRPQDPPEFTYVLVTLDLPQARIVGQLEGALAKVPAYWEETNRGRGIHRAAHFVPQTALEPWPTPPPF